MVGDDANSTQGGLMGGIFSRFGLIKTSCLLWRWLLGWLVGWLVGWCCGLNIGFWSLSSPPLFFSVIGRPWPQTAQKKMP